MIPRGVANTAAILATVSFLASCSDDQQKSNQQVFYTARPAQYVTAYDARSHTEGRPSTRGPIALASAPDGGLLMITEAGWTITKTGPGKDGRTSVYSNTGWQLGTPIDMTANKEGTIFAIGRSLTTPYTYQLARIRRNRSVEVIKKLGRTREVKQLNVSATPSGRIILTQDGRAYEISERDSKISALNLPGLKNSDRILDATPDGDRLLIAFSDELVWARGNRIVRRLKVPEIPNSDEGITIAPDGLGGAYVSTKGRSVVTRLRPDRKVSTILLGNSHDPVICGDTPVSGSNYLGPGRSQHRLTSANALLRQHSQLYVADTRCNRVLALGLPAHEALPSS